MLNKRIKTSLFTTILGVAFFVFVNINYVFASPSITSFTLNGEQKNATFNPNNGESISIEVKANTLVKFTRLYICSVNQICNGTSGNYTRYFSQSDISDTIIKVWNGKNSGDKEIVPAGEYKVMVSMTEGTDKPITEFGQYSIIIDFSGQNQVIQPNDDEPVNDSNTPDTGPNNAVLGDISLHSSEEELSNYDDGKTLFELSAGRERITYIGVPVEFTAKYYFDKSFEGKALNFNWSYGDGTSANGEKVVHSYRYLGEYNIILNGELGNERSVSRTSVKVLFPEVSIGILDDGNIQLKNNGKVEINFGDWVIKNLSARFIFPKDTIVGSGKNIILAKEDTKVFVNKDESLTLFNPSGGEVVSTKSDDNKNVSKDLIENSQTIEEILGMSKEKAESLIINYKNSLVIKDSKKDEDKVVTNSVVQVDKNEESPIQSASVLNSVVHDDTVSSDKGFWNNFVGRGLKSFARIFYDF